MPEADERRRSVPISRIRPPSGYYRHAIDTDWLTRKRLRMMKRSQMMLGTAVVASALLMGGCQPGDDTTDYDAVGQDEKSSGGESSGDGKDAAKSDDGHAQEVAAAQPRLVTTYDGGIMTLDATTLDVIADTKLEGFNRLNPVGDDRHLMVSVAEGFRLLRRRRVDSAARRPHPQLRRRPRPHRHRLRHRAARATSSATTGRPCSSATATARFRPSTRTTSPRMNRLRKSSKPKNPITESR